MLRSRPFQGCASNIPLTGREARIINDIPEARIPVTGATHPRKHPTFLRLDPAGEIRNIKPRAISANVFIPLRGGVQHKRIKTGV